MTQLIALILWSDTLDKLNWKATVLSPIFLIVVVAAAILSERAKSPADRWRILGLAFLLGISAGLLGWLALESPTPGYARLEAMVRAPFLFCKWFVLGFAAGWIGCSFATDPSRRPPAAIQWLVAGVGLILGGVTAAGTVLVPELYERDIAFWNGALDPATTSFDLSEARRHLSTKGRQRIDKILWDRPNGIQAGVLRGLHQLGVAGVWRARHAPPDLIAEAAARIRQRRTPGRLEQSVMMDLAKNPALDADTFALLCSKGDERVLLVLIRNPGNDTNRMQRLRANVEERLAAQITDAGRQRWRDLLKRVDRWGQSRPIPQ